FFCIRFGWLLLVSEAVTDDLFELLRRPLEGAAQVRLAMSEAPAHLGRVVFYLTDHLKPGAVRITEGGVALAALARKDDELEVLGQALQEFAGVLFALTFAISREINGQLLERNLAFEGLVNFQRDGRFVRIELI